ncbi:MAG: site-2 protease family protein [Armatimonadota bacterium]
MQGWRIGRLFGINVEIHFTWLIIFGMILWLVTSGILPDAAPGASRTELWIIGVIATVLFFLSLLLHEISHSLMANRLGADVSRITLFVFGGVSQMRREPGSPSAELKIAIVGPLTSVVLGGLFLGLHVLLRSAGLPQVWWAAANWVGRINLYLAAFNMLPAFPLDGGRVLRAALWSSWNSLERATRHASAIGRGFGYLMIAVGVFGMFFGGWGGLWFVALGWLLSSAAAGSYQRLQLEQALGDVYVHDLMSSPVATIPADATLDEAAHNYFMAARFTAFAVEDEGRIVGMVRMEHLQNVPREQWQQTSVSEVMQALDPSVMAIKSDAQAVEALIQMAQNDLGRLLVTDRAGNVIGIISHSDIVRLVKVRSGLGV